jgi:thiol-disulfide isomerase/thioredoxin
MYMKKKVSILIGIIAVAGIGYLTYAFFEGEDDCAESTCQIDKADLVMIDTKEPTLPNTRGPSGSFEIYSNERLAQTTTDTVIIFFHATWCPSCRALSADIERNKGAIPEGITILKADFDTETELRKKYGVTTQHTLVQVDANGALVKKWSGHLRLETVLSEIQE